MTAAPGAARRPWKLFLLTAGCAAAMMLLLYAVLGITPFGDGTVLTGDLNGQYIPYFSHFKRFFAGEAGFAYGFDKSLGGSLLGLFAYYVASPLNLLYLSVPLAGFPVVASVLLLAKVVLASTFFQVFLAHKYPLLGFMGLLPSLGYGFCAYAFVYAQNIMWHDVLLLMPLICLGIDRLLAGRGPALYIASLALAIFANFYIGYMACLYAVLYFAGSLLLQPKAARRLKASLLTFGGASLLAGGLTMVLLLPALLNVNDSKGSLFSLSFSLSPQFGLWQLLEKLSFGSFLWPDVQDGLPLVYCGLVLPLLALCFFLSPKVRRRAKLVAALGLAGLVLSFWLSGLDVLWHGLKAPVWFPYRYSWLFCFTLALVAASALAHGAAAKKELLLSGGIVAVLFLVLALLPRDSGRLKLAASAAAVVVLAVGLLLYSRASTTGRRRVLALGLAGFTALELTANAFLSLRQFEPYTLSGFGSYLEEVGGTVAAIRAADDLEADQYRLDKNFYRTLNDPMLLDYHGVSHFGSTQDNASTDTLYSLGYRGNGSYLYGSTAFADAVLGLRWLMADDSRRLPAHWEASGLDAPLATCQNPYWMPLLFTASDAVARADFGEGPQDETFAYQNQLYTALSGHEEPLLREAPAELLDADGQALPLAGEVPPGGGYRVTAAESGYHYALLLAPGGALYDLDTYLDDAPAGKTFSADQSGLLNLGWLEEGDSVTLSWHQGGPFVVEYAAFACLAAAPLEALSRQARENAATYQLADGRVSGSAEATEGRTLLFTSLPYDEGWQAVVNGRTLQPLEVAGGLMALPLETGHNTFSLTYKVAGALPGVALSLCSVLGCLLWALLARRRKPSKPL